MSYCMLRNIKLCGLITLSRTAVLSHTTKHVPLRDITLCRAGFYCRRSFSGLRFIRRNSILWVQHSITFCGPVTYYKILYDVLFCTVRFRSVQPCYIRQNVTFPDLTQKHTVVQQTGKKQIDL
jgi:hypothetical protein